MKTGDELRAQRAAYQRAHYQRNKEMIKAKRRAHYQTVKDVLKQQYQNKKLSKILKNVQESSPEQSTD